MKNKTRIVSMLLVGLVFIPQVTFAAWWNPFSWNIFNKKSAQMEVKNVPLDSLQTAEAEPTKKTAPLKSTATTEPKKETAAKKKAVVSLPSFVPAMPVPVASPKVSTPPEPKITTTAPVTPSPSVQLPVQTLPAPTLSISGVGTTSTETTVTMQWSTSIPSNDKVFLLVNGVRKQVATSSLSTIHSANLKDLSSGTTYNFTIESIANDGITNTQYNGTVTTKTAPVVVVPVKEQPEVVQFTAQNNPSYSSVTSTGNKKGVTIGSFTLTNTQSKTVRITNLQTALSSTVNISNLSISDIGNGTPVMPSSVNNFPPYDMRLEPGETRVINVKADMDDGAMVTVSLTATGVTIVQ